MDLTFLLQQVMEQQDAALFYTSPVYPNARCFYFKKPFKVIETSDPSALIPMLSEVDMLLNNGFKAYGYITYEAGYLFEDKLNGLCPDNSTLLKFVFFHPEDVLVFSSDEITEVKWSEEKTNISAFKINTSQQEYISAIEKIKYYIAEGYTYQVNYTVKGEFDFKGDTGELFKKLLFSQSSRYSAFINSGENIILSLSPELFFRTEGSEIITRPMKGTIKRGNTAASDAVYLDILKASEKNKAENLMIVDLLRNDLGKISRFGSVEVPSLFEIEKYESLYQKTSVVKSRLNDGMQFSDIIKSIFPSGSITGAPKIKTMQIINELEKEPRGLYTGALGIITGNEVVFNVAIRTIVLNKQAARGNLGIGSGIVWDSNSKDEFNETLLKADFLLKPGKYFEIIETMKYETGNIFFLDEHLDRMEQAADFFLFQFNREKIVEMIKEKIIEAGSSCILRLLLNKWGDLSIELKKLTKNPISVKAIISKKNTDSTDTFRYFKTTNRQLYDDEYRKYSAEGFFDVIFFNDRDELCEGAITNIFVKLDGMWFTPPVSSGILNGIYRNYYLTKNRDIKEKTISREELLNADEVLLTNSVRGPIKAQIIL